MSCALDPHTDYLLNLMGPTTVTSLSWLLDGTLGHDHLTR